MVRECDASLHTCTYRGVYLSILTLMNKRHLEPKLPCLLDAAALAFARRAGVHIAATQQLLSNYSVATQ